MLAEIALEPTQIHAFQKDIPKETLTEIKFENFQLEILENLHCCERSWPFFKLFSASFTSTYLKVALNLVRTWFIWSWNPLNRTHVKYVSLARSPSSTTHPLSDVKRCGKKKRRVVTAAFCLPPSLTHLAKIGLRNTFSKLNYYV
jgi:hypothetical protein